MHIELTELLCCPRCGPPHGLIAFVEAIDERRVLVGHLDCPSCEARYPIAAGAVRFDETAPGDRAEQEPPDELRPGALPDDAASIAAALLGPAEGPELLFVAGAAAALAPMIAELRPEAAVVAWGRGGAAHARVFPVVPGTTDLPGLRPGRLDGAVVAGGAPELVASVAPALAPGAHLVVLDPRPAFSAPPGTGLTELASDPRAWVGARG